MPPINSTPKKEIYVQKILFKIQWHVFSANLVKTVVRVRRIAEQIGSFDFMGKINEENVESPEDKVSETFEN